LLLCGLIWKGSSAAAAPLLFKLFPFFRCHGHPSLAEPVFPTAPMAETTAATETAEQDLREDQQPQGLPEGDDGQVKDLGDQCIPQQHDDGAEGEYAEDGKEKEARKFCSAKTSHGIYFICVRQFGVPASADVRLDTLMFDDLLIKA
jgi:hypothetical protein